MGACLCVSVCVCVCVCNDFTTQHISTSVSNHGGVGRNGGERGEKQNGCEVKSEGEKSIKVSKSESARERV